ncbi:hypothetical protein [Prochlorococcus marinus]|uniref:hypothetical protein n=1 Tax=Prochlorococcus marinus TaxID=1219 RepID=UPI0022B48FAF|nr:hypothetical protein [Prochlorococcus marinus]
MTNFSNFPRNIIPWVALGGSGLAIFLSIPKAAENFKPIDNKRIENITDFEILSDKKTGDIYGWIEGKEGEMRFVKMDENSENKVRSEREKSKEKARIEEAKRQAALEKERSLAEGLLTPSINKEDIRSEQIFEKNTTFKDYKVNAKIKYRLRERSMLYRIAISLKDISDNVTNPMCESIESIDSNLSAKLRGERMLSLIKGKDNQIRFRFVDADDFWLKDTVIPLDSKKANNLKTTVIDAYHKDECGNLNKLVFHGQMSDYSLPDYSWVEDGKLLFSGVKVIEPEEENNEDK